MIRQHILLVVGLVGLTACNTHKANNKTDTSQIDTNKSKSVAVKAVKKVATIDTSRYTGPDDTVPKVIIPDGTIQVGINNQPVDTTNKSYFLLDGNTNSENISPDEIKLKWKGIFWKEDGTAYIKDVNLRFEHAQSATDEEGQKTGWDVKSDDKDNGYFLSGITDLTNGPIQKVKIIKAIMYPGEKQEFNYNSTSYTIYAKGFKKNGDIYNYRLYLLANIKGHYFNQLLAAEEHFGDEMHWEDDAIIQIDFVGDIDGDNIPDVIISRLAEISGDWSLYLSKSAGEKAILKYRTGFGSSE